MKEARATIDALDEALVALLAERAAVVRAVWHDKAQAGLGRHDAAREAEIYARVRERAAAAGLDPDAVEAVFRQVVGREF